MFEAEGTGIARTTCDRRRSLSGKKFTKKQRRDDLACLC